MNRAILKNKYFIAAVATGLVVIMWYVWRDYNTKKAVEDTGILISELEQYQGTEAWEDPDNWTGYEFGDPIPEAAKQ